MYTLNRTPPVRGWTRAKARCPYRPFLERFEDRLVPANTPPILAPISNQLVNEGSLLSLTATASDTDIPRQTLRFSLVTAPSGATISSTTGLFRWTPTEAQGPGTFNVTIRVTDNGSPSLSDQKSFTITVNEVNRAPVLAAISNQTVNEGSLLALTVSATDPDLPANTLSYSLVTAPSGATLDPTTGAFRWTPTEAQGPGTYTVTVRATDNGSPNLSSQRSFTVTVREVNQAPVLAAISNQTVNEGSLLSLTATATDPDLPANTLSYSLVTAPSGATISSTTGLFRWTPTEAQGPGTFNVTIRVTDNGSPSLSDQKSFTVTVNEVNRAPVLAAISNQTVNEGSLLALTVSATDPDLPANTLSYSLVTAPSGATLDPTTGAFRWTPTEAQGPGTYTVTVRATDNGSPNLSSQRSFTVTVREVNQPPVLNPISDRTVDEQTLLSFTVSATDPDLPANTLRYSLVTAPSGATLSSTTGLFRWTPTEAQGPGTYTITVRVTDNGSPSMSDQKSFTVTVNEVNRPPVLAAISNKTVDEQTLLAFTVSATDPDLPANTLRYSLLTAPSGVTLDPTTGAFRWTPTEAQGPGTYTVTVRVTDSGSPSLSDQKSFTVTVREVNQPPVLNPISDQTVNEGSLLSFRVSATDADLPANALRYSLVTAPGGATLDPNTGLFGWTPTEAQGPESYTITVRVTDDGSPNLSDQKSFTVTVREVNQAPVLAAIADQFIFLGGTVALDVTALDADLPAQELRYRLLAGPAGASLDARTGAFRWSPAFPQGPGVYQVTVAVSDGGAEVLESFTIRVAQVLPPSAFANALAAPEDRPIPGFTSLKAVPEGRFLPVSVSPLSFGTYVGGDEAGRYAHVAGQVFEDLNSDGDQNSDERGLEGTLVILSRMRGDAFVPLASTRTDANGRFTFADVEPGQYRVWPVLPGKMELSPGSGVRAVTVQVAERVGEVNFGAVPRGTVFLTPHVEPPQPQAPTMDKDSPWEGTDGLSCLPAADSPQVWGEPRLWEQAMLAALASGGIGVRSNQDAADGGRNRKDETPPTTRA